MGRDYSGRKFNKLTLHTRVGGGGAQRGAIWLAQCECGNMKEVVAKDVARGRVKSCGKCKEKQEPIPGISRARNASERSWYSKYVRQAFREGRKWALTYHDLTEIANKPCATCAQKVPHSSLRLKLWDPMGDYSPGNVVNICPSCSGYIGRHNIAEFLDYVCTVADILRQQIK